MGYATMVVQAEADEDGRGRIGLAMALAHQFDALLVGAAARDFMPVMAMPGAEPGVGVLLAAEDQEIRVGLDAAERQFRAVTDGNHERVAWRSIVGDPSEMLAREARTADLIVVGRRPEGAETSRSRHADPGEVLMRAGRPVLVVPPGLSHLDTHHVVVAWKDSLEARRAVIDALPFLKQAASVLVLQVCHTVDEQELAASVVRDVAEYLSRHGVPATGEARLQREASVPAELLLAAEQQRAELVVAGGYAHSRLQEWAFGGLTSALLRHFPKCCLLSH